VHGTRYRKIKAYLQDPNLKAPTGGSAAIKLRWGPLNEYELYNNALYFIDGRNNNGKRVVLDYMQQRTKAMLEKYHEINHNEV